MKFEFYVLNYDFNRKCIYRFNIFNNCRVQEWTEKAIKKYLMAPKKYKHVATYPSNYISTEVVTYGYDALCNEFKSIFKNQFWSRREYEISISDAFVTEVSDLIDNIDSCKDVEEIKDSLIKVVNKNPKLEKWDVYGQLEYNIPMIVNECIRQYKQQLKEN